jgi:ligand-binding sensor domain-containing protein
MKTTNVVIVVAAIVAVGAFAYKAGRQDFQDTRVAEVPGSTPGHPVETAPPSPVAGHPQGQAAATGQAVTAAGDPHANMHAGNAPSQPMGHRFAHFRVGNSNVKALLADGPVMWVGTSGGVIRYDVEQDQHQLFDVRAGLLSNGIFHLSRLGKRIAVGTYGGGLSLFDEANNDWSNYNIQHGLGDAFIYDLLQLPNGDIWIATWSGANLIKGGHLDDREAWTTFTVASTDGGLPNDWVYGLAEGKHGEVWFATEGGLARYKDGHWENWKHEDGLGAPYELVRDQIEFERDPAKESSHHARQKVEMGLQGVDVAYNPNYIVSLYVDEEGHVWAGTWGGGLARFDGDSWRHYTVSDGLPANHVFMLESDGNGAMWVGTSNGMAHFDGKRFEVLTTQDGLYANNVFSLARGDDGSLWVGSFGGVARLVGLESRFQ